MPAGLLLESMKDPTATHIDDEAHDTADSVAVSGTDTFVLGAGAIVQLAAPAAAGADSTTHTIMAIRKRPRGFLHPLSMRAFSNAVRV